MLARNMLLFCSAETFDAMVAPHTCVQCSKHVPSREALLPRAACRAHRLWLPIRFPGKLR